MKRANGTSFMKNMKMRFMFRSAMKIVFVLVDRLNNQWS
jgi:hypothetical protein